MLVMVSIRSYIMVFDLITPSTGSSSADSLASVNALIMEVISTVSRVTSSGYADKVSS